MEDRLDQRPVSLRRGSAGAVALLAAVSLLASVLLAAAADMPYLGEWSNGRGETLVITAKTLQFGEERAVPYRDVTRATDGESFELQITARDEVNRLGGKTLAIEFDDDAMKITAYASHADYMQEKDPRSVVTWFKEDE